jgi:hypothetical protein
MAETEAGQVGTEMKDKFSYKVPPSEGYV